MTNQTQKCEYARRNELQQRGRMRCEWPGPCQHQSSQDPNTERDCTLYPNPGDRREELRVPGASADHVVPRIAGHGRFLPRDKV
jgi:hypothetical protein